MPLQISYTESTGPGTAHYQAVDLPLSWERPLAEGQLASERVIEVAEEFAATAQAQLGITVEYSTDPADYPPTPAPTPEEQQAAEVLSKYLDRSQAAPRVMARWAAGNDVRLATFAALVQAGEFPAEPDPADHEDPKAYEAAQEAWLADYDPDTHGWAPRLFGGFMAQVAPVVVLLNSLAFGATAQAVQAFSHPLATPAAKAAYLADMAAEGALP